MRIRIVALGIAVVLIAIMTVPGQSGDEKKGFKPVMHFGGVVLDKEKMKLAPANGFVTKQEDLEKIWDGWSVKEKMPKLDFAKQLVLVHLASGPNLITTTYMLRDGDLTARSLQTLKAGPGFGFGIDVLNREGIKTYKGKPVE